MAKKKLYIKTYGCQMNAYDSFRMADLMAPVGYEEASSPENADMVVLNTCHIREKAADKVYSELGRIRLQKEALKAQGQEMILVVAGCVGQAEGEEIFRRAPYVDVVVGPQSYHNLPDLVSKAQRDAGRVINLDFTEEEKFDNLPDKNAKSQGVSAFLTIQEGCDKFCTFCVVPYTRGAEFSRPVSEIYREAVRLADGGAKEITLLGQNVNAYHGAGDEGNIWSLGQLIHHVAKIDSVERIRYTTSHPRDVDDELIAAHGSEAKLMPYLHLPVQSGSDNILKQMNRKHTAEEYVRIVERLRAARKDLEFSSDFIVGFPGETDQDFEDTLTLIREIGYAQAYSFKYSPRPGTPGALREDHVPEEAKAERLARLQALVNEQQLAFNRKMIGRTLPVLFDRKGKRDGQLVGRSPYMQSVYIKDGGQMHDTIDVVIEDAFANSLSGSIAREERQEAA